MSGVVLFGEGGTCHLEVMVQNPCHASYVLTYVIEEDEIRPYE